MKINREQRFHTLWERVTKKKLVHEGSILVENSNGSFSYSEGYGGRDVDSPMVIASITKLFTTTCIIKLQEQGLLSLDDTLPKYFKSSVLDGLHTLNGKEYADGLMLKDLIYQVSGLPDIFDETSNSVRKRIIKQDFYLTFEETVNIAKSLKPHNVPRASKRAYYADINFDMLGEIIEQVTELPLDQVYRQFIFEPLGLKKTYLPTSDEELIPDVYFKEQLASRPLAVMSSRASGGCVSTVRELMIFLKAFFACELFDTNLWTSASDYHKLQPSWSPLQYGCGHMRIPLEGFATMFQGKGALYGHSGSTGTFAFYYPEQDLFFVGDINQMALMTTPVRLVIQMAMQSKDK